MSEAILCSRCGGPLPAAAAHVAVTCPYCAATNAPAPKVVEHVVERLVVATPKDAPGGLRCPRCADPLRSTRVHDTDLSSCDHCGGIWVDKVTVERLTARRDPDVETAVRRICGAVFRRVDRQKLASCPVCGQAMKRREIPETVVLLDACDAHGTWFDALELNELIRSAAEARAGEISEADAEAAGVPSEGLFGKLAKMFG